jgi:hypothetical protein
MKVDEGEFGRIDSDEGIREVEIETLVGDEIGTTPMR